jgi:hypothetical protein
MNQKSKKLEGKVALVLNERELVINIGLSNGVKQGMCFAVLAETSLPVIDPATGERLGNLDREKVRVQVIDVQDRLTVCKTYYFRETGFNVSSFNPLATLVGPYRRVYETLDAAKENYPAPLSQEQSYVQIGDRVRQIEGEESE